MKRLAYMFLRPIFTQSRIKQYVELMTQAQFNKEYITTAFQSCNTLGDVGNVIRDVISYVEKRVLYYWNRNTCPMGDTYENRTITYHGTVYRFWWYADSGCISFEVGELKIQIRFEKGGMALERLVSHIEELLVVVRNIMPAYLVAKGKAQRLYGMQLAGMTAELNTLLEKNSISPHLEIGRGMLGRRGWVIQLAGYKCDRSDKVIFEICGEYPEKRQNLVILMDPLFRFISLDQCIDIKYRSPSDNGKIFFTWRLEPEAPFHIDPYFYAFRKLNLDLILEMSSMEEFSWQNVLVELHGKNNLFWIDGYRVYFMFDFRKYTPEEFCRVIEELNKGILAPLENFKKEGNHTDLSIFIDFEKALAAANKNVSPE